ncbi:cytochrome P450 [Amycolatopsis anabasis]|uniref:cytochrome P450 n=1 Tax=Amycolatopsis anabasis TaxID=1840409 RepID=UPI00131A9C5F|nr:cytochrome P450 [Amycolatopsis anabasis]
MVITLHPEHIHTILARTNRDSFPDPDVLENHRAPTREHTEQWIQARALAWRALKPRALAPHLPAVDRALDQQLHALAGRDVDAGVLPTVCTHAALPACVRTPSPGLGPAVVAASSAIIDVIGLSRRLPRWLPSRRRRRAYTTRAHARQHLDQFAADHTPPPPGCPHTVADEVLDPHCPATRAVSERALATTLLASAVVPGTALAWLLYELGQRPHELAHLRTEATTTGLPTAVDTLARGGDLATALPRTHACTQEVLRMHPPTWLMYRQLTTAITLDGHHIPAGHTIAFSPYHVHRDSRWWTNPHDFHPQRWLRPQPPHTPHAYLPFGAGPRVCFGAHLGAIILTLTAARIATSYHLHLIDPHRVTPHFGVPYRPRNLHFRLEPRTTTCRTRPVPTAAANREPDTPVIT